MPNPVSPSDLLALIPTTGSAFCDRFLRFLELFPTKYVESYSWMFNEDGSLTADFKADICGIDCTTLPSGGGGTGFASPTATWSSPRLSWNAISGAAYYEVVRSTENDVQEGTLIATTTLTFFDDSPTTDTWFYYFVRARNATTIGPFSLVAVGGIGTLPQLPAPGSVGATNNITAYVTVTWAVSAGATTYKVWRNTSNTLSGATLLVTTPMLFYNDFTGILGTAYYYIVQSINSANTGLTGSHTGQRT